MRTSHVILAFNRPACLEEVLQALSRQEVENLLIFIDGARTQEEEQLTSACRELAEAVSWCEPKVFARRDNTGLGGILNSISEAFEHCDRAIFIEDDCLPMPSFTEFMLSGLDKYELEPDVFSIAGYQPLREHVFRKWPFCAVSSPRFMCWGWATWRDKWKHVEEVIPDFWRCFDKLNKIPESAGIDLARAAGACARGETDTWDVRVAIAALSLGMVHMHPVCGLVRNSGVGTGSNPAAGFRSSGFVRRLHNKNVCEESIPKKLSWPDDVSAQAWYLEAWLSFVRSYTQRTRLLNRLYQTFLKGPLVWLGRKTIKRGFPKLWEKAKGFRRGARNSNKILEDVFLLNEQEKPQKRALLSYLKAPVEKWRPGLEPHKHIFLWRIPAIVRILNRMGYLVDVVDYTATGIHLNKVYDLFIGHGAFNYLELHEQLSPRTIEVHFATNTSGAYHDKANLARYEGLPPDKKRAIRPDRPAYFENENKVLEVADGIIVGGNEWTAGTFNTDTPVYHIGNIARKRSRATAPEKNWNRARHNFLYFAGTCGYHKGLDLLLAAFSGRQEQLWVCAKIPEDFAQAYQNELKGLTNINYVGWIKSRSWRYYDIVDRCGFTILPSCAEGGCQSIYEGMNQGLIPVVTPMCGVDTGDFGITISECTTAAVADALAECNDLNAEDLKARSSRAQELARTKYSEEAFERKFESAVAEILRLKQQNA